MTLAPRARLAIAVICLGSLVAPLDTTVNTAFPVITGAFGLALRDIQWVVIPFVLAQTSLALVFGHLGDRIGHRRVFAAGMAACVLGHLAVALAPDFPLLVAGRVLQGMAVGMAVSCAPALVTLLVPPADKARMLAVYAAVNSLGMALGPWVGGLLLQALGWPGVFLFRAPIALLALLMLPAVPAVSVRREGPGAGGFDWLGALGLIGVLATLALALTELTRPGAAWWSGTGLLALGLTGALAWVRHESRAAHPVMRIAPFRSARFSGIQAASVIVNLACFANLLLLPYVLTRQAGMAIAQAGLALSVYPAGSVLGNALAGRLARRLGAPGLMAWGLVVAVAGLGLSAVVLGLVAGASGPAILPLAAGMLVSGLGLGLFQVGYMDQTTTLLPVHERGVAGSLVSVTRLLGILLGATGIGWLQGLTGQAAASFGVLAVALAVFTVSFLLAGRPRPGSG
jgi:MFS family permease